MTLEVFINYQTIVSVFSDPKEEIMTKNTTDLDKETDFDRPRANSNSHVRVYKKFEDKSKVRKFIPIQSVIVLKGKSHNSEKSNDSFTCTNSLSIYR